MAAPAAARAPAKAKAVGRRLLALAPRRLRGGRVAADDEEEDGESDGARTPPPPRRAAAACGREPSARRGRRPAERRRRLGVWLGGHRPLVVARPRGRVESADRGSNPARGLGRALRLTRPVRLPAQGGRGGAGRRARATMTSPRAGTHPTLAAPSPEPPPRPPRPRSAAAAAKPPPPRRPAAAAAGARSRASSAAWWRWAAAPEEAHRGATPRSLADSSAPDRPRPCPSPPSSLCHLPAHRDGRLLVARFCRGGRRRRQRRGGQDGAPQGAHPLPPLRALPQQARRLTSAAASGLRTPQRVALCTPAAAAHRAASGTAGTTTCCRTSTRPPASVAS